MIKKTKIQIGLEVHIRLKTNHKLYSSSLIKSYNALDQGEPGTLPQPLNKEALRLVIRLSLLLKTKIHHTFYPSRKLYFYPDLPKGYQTSQSDPIGIGGYLALGSDDNTVHIRQIHLEEDAAQTNKLGICYKRSGISLAEVVTEPDFTSIETTLTFLKSLRSLAIAYNISDCLMEEGQFRCDVNVSYDNGARAEIKNLNSFCHIQQALEFEITHQESTRPRQEPVTLFFDEERKVTYVSRNKEKSEEYLYIHDPDIQPVEVDKSIVQEEQSFIKMRQNDISTISNLGLDSSDIEKVFSIKKFNTFLYLARHGLSLTKFFHLYMQTIYKDDHQSLLSDSCIEKIYLYFYKKLIGKEGIAKLIAAIHAQKLVTPIKDSDVSLFSYSQYNQDELEDVVTKIIQQHQQAYNDYISGKKKAMSFLIKHTLAACQNVGIRVNPSTIVAEIDRISNTDCEK